MQGVDELVEGVDVQAGKALQVGKDGAALGGQEGVDAEGKVVGGEVGIVPKGGV